MVGEQLRILLDTIENEFSPGQLSGDVGQTEEARVVFCVSTAPWE